MQWIDPARDFHRAAVKAALADSDRASHPDHQRAFAGAAIAPRSGRRWPVQMPPRPLRTACADQLLPDNTASAKPLDVMTADYLHRRPATPWRETLAPNGGTRAGA